MFQGTIPQTHNCQACGWPWTLRAIKNHWTSYRNSLMDLRRALLIRVATSNILQCQRCGCPLGSCKIRCCSSGIGCSRSALLTFETIPKLRGFRLRWVAKTEYIIMVSYSWNSWGRPESPRGGSNNCQGAQMCGALFGQRCSVVFPDIKWTQHPLLGVCPNDSWNLSTKICMKLSATPQDRKSRSSEGTQIRSNDFLDRKSRSSEGTQIRSNDFLGHARKFRPDSQATDLTTRVVDMLTTISYPRSILEDSLVSNVEIILFWLATYKDFQLTSGWISLHTVQEVVYTCMWSM